MNGNARVTKTQDLTPYFTESIIASGKIKAARVAGYEDGTRAIEIMFHDHIPQVERNVIIIAVGENLVNMCAELDKPDRGENAPFLEFMDGAKIKEWSET